MPQSDQYSYHLKNNVPSVPYLNDPWWYLWVMTYESISMVTQQQQDV
jgi:hypothetical protein